MGTETTRVSSYFRCEGYYDASGNFCSSNFERLNSAMTDTSGLTLTAATLNKVQYAATAHKIAYGSAVVTAGSSTVSMAEAGITTLAYFVAFPQGSCVSYVTLTAATGSNATIICVSGGAAITAGIGVNWMAVNA